MIRRITGRVKKVWAGIALLSVEMALVFGLFVVSLVAFVLLARRVLLLQTQEFDEGVFERLQPFVNETNNKIMLFVTFLGKHEFLIPANLLLIAYFLFFKKHKWYSIKIPAIALSSLAMMFFLKNYFERERPLIPLLEEARGLSFPSGHALMAVTFYGLMIYIIWHSVKDPRLKWALIGALLILINLIGFSRIYLRVHYTTDVIAGFAMGVIWLVVSLKGIRQIEKFSRAKFNPVVEKPEEPVGLETQLKTNP
ncbi:MAG TPA: phosphatase PAP2 family protein [Chitinophagaceae bacterium]